MPRRKEVNLPTGMPAKSFQYFQLKIGDVDGRVTDFRAGVTWMFSKHVGVGAGYNAFTTKVNVTKEAFDGSMKWRYSGAQIFITGSF